MIDVAKGLFAWTLGAGVAALALPWFGFASAGVTAGSMAAAWQGPAVATGSWFATFQSLGATGALGAVAVKTGVASASAYVGGKIWGRR